MVQIWKEGDQNITLKNNQEINSMRKGGKILATILNELKEITKVGTTTKDLDLHAEKMMEKFNVKPSFKGFHGYPAVLCTNVNHEVVHGIPNDTPLLEGDLLTIDCGVVLDNLHTDSAISFIVGKSDVEKQKMIDVGVKALNKAIQVARPGIRVKEISKVIQSIIEENGYSIVKDLVGHGIGLELHEDPYIPNFVDKDPGPILQTGMTIAIEPIFSMGNGKIKTLDDNWTIITADKSLAVQVEHTIAITQKGSEVLTTV